MGNPVGAARPIIAVLDTLSPSMRDVLKARFAEEFKILFPESQDPASWLEMVREATVIFTIWSPVDADLIEAAKRCKLIQKLGVGVDKIDIPAAQSRKITVLRAAGINSDAVADMVLLLTLAVVRRFRWASEELRAGRFQKEVMRSTTFQLAGRTVGLVGFGHIGRATAKRFSSFGAKVVYYDVVRQDPETERALGASYVTLEQLVAMSDIISLHVPNTPQTRGMFNAQLFAQMKAGAVIVNTARGSLIDEAALVDAIRQGIVFGAGLDVTAQEPLPPDSPLLQLENVVVTPHMAGAVADNFPRVVEHVYQNVLKVLNGEEAPATDKVS